MWESRLIGLLGGKSYLTISLYFFRITVFFEVIGAKVVPTFKLKYDVVGYSELCYSADWIINTLKFIVTADLDVNECAFGAFASFLPGKVADCQWRNYYIDHSLYELDPFQKAWQGTVIPENCV